MAKITSSGELREFLCSCINNVANGTMDANKARDVTKLAGQVHESLYSEVRVAKTQIELGAEAAKFGTLPLSAPKDEK